jgi:hypothetical protein
MNEFFPEVLQPVHYFLVEINNEIWLNCIRAAIGIIVVATIFFYVRFRKSSHPGKTGSLKNRVG